MLGMAQPTLQPSGGLLGSMSPQYVNPAAGGIGSFGSGGGISPGLASWIMEGQQPAKPTAVGSGGALGAASPQVAYGTNYGQPQSSPLINTASSYNFPISSGLMGGIAGGLGSSSPTTPASSAPAGGTDWTQVALGLAGNPKAGPLATAAVPGAAQGAPGAGSSSSSSGGSKLGSTLGGLLTAIASNPSLASGLTKSVGSLAQSIFGGGSGASALGTGDTLLSNLGINPATGIDAASQAALDSSIASDLSSTGLDAAASNGGFGSLVGSVADPAAGAAAADATGTGVAGASGSLGGDAAASAAADAGGGSSSALTGLAAAWPIAVGAGGLLGLNALFNKQSEQSPASIANMDYTSAANLSNAAKQVGAGSTGPNGVYQGYGGVTQADVQNALQAQSGLMQYLGNTVLQPGSAAWQALQTGAGPVNPTTSLSQSRNIRLS